MNKQDIGIHFLNRVEYKIYNFFITRILAGKSNVFDKGQKVLARILKCHENSIGNAVKVLENLGWLKRIRTGKRNSLIFTLPEEAIQCRINYLTDLESTSFSAIESRAEFRQIKKKQLVKFEHLKEELLLLKQEQTKKQRPTIDHPLSKEIISGFVDKLLVRLNNYLDPRSMEDQVLCELDSLKKRLVNEVEIEESSSIDVASLSDYDYTSSSVHTGIDVVNKLFNRKGED